MVVGDKVLASGTAFAVVLGQCVQNALAFLFPANLSETSRYAKQCGFILCGQLGPQRFDVQPTKNANVTSVVALVQL